MVVEPPTLDMAPTTAGAGLDVQEPLVWLGQKGSIFIAYLNNQLIHLNGVDDFKLCHKLCCVWKLEFKIEMDSPLKAGK